jgi:hypothetical protein
VTLVRLASQGTVDEAIGGDVHSTKSALSKLLLARKEPWAQQQQQAEEGAKQQKKKEAVAVAVPSLYRSIWSVWNKHCRDREQQQQAKQQA